MAANMCKLGKTYNGHQHFRLYNSRKIFQGFQFLQIGDLYHFMDLIFADAHGHVRYTLDNNIRIRG